MAGSLPSHQIQLMHLSSHPTLLPNPSECHSIEQVQSVVVYIADIAFQIGVGSVSLT